MKNTISGNPAKAMMKLLVAADSDQVVGVHMVGPECAEIMQARPLPACGPLPLSATERRGPSERTGCGSACSACMHTRPVLITAWSCESREAGQHHGAAGRGGWHPHPTSVHVEGLQRGMLRACNAAC
jgi:hypothetical protein